MKLDEILLAEIGVENIVLRIVLEFSNCILCILKQVHTDRIEFFKTLPFVNNHYKKTPNYRRLFIDGHRFPR